MDHSARCPRRRGHYWLVSVALTLLQPDIVTIRSLDTWLLTRIHLQYRIGAACCGHAVIIRSWVRGEPGVEATKRAAPSLSYLISPAGHSVTHAPAPPCSPTDHRPCPGSCCCCCCGFLTPFPPGPLAFRMRPSHRGGFFLVDKARRVIRNVNVCVSSTPHCAYNTVAADKGLATAGEQCCGDACISADLSCCPDGQWYCDDPVDVCVPCQSGGVCYDDEGDQTPWNCCSNGGSDCVFSVSSGTVSSSGTVAPSSSTPPSNPTTTATPAAASPVSPTPILAAATSSMLTPPSGPNPSGPILTAADPGVTSPNTVPAITTPTQPPWSGYNYHESLLVGTCATPEFSLVCGAQATAVYLIGIVGCMGSKTDCCPYQVPSTTATVATTVTDTAVPITEPQFFFPTATVSSQVTLPHCPADYVTISSVCCPA